MKILRKIGRALGLTAESRTELSDVIYENAKIVDDTEEEDAHVVMRVAGPLVRANPIAGAMIPGLLARREVSILRVVGEHVSFDLSDFDEDKIDPTLRSGDKVRMGYRSATACIFDYVLPNFDCKAGIKRESEPYELRPVSVERAH